MVGEPLVRVEILIAIELVGIPMKGVGSGLGDDIDDVSGAPSILRGEGVALDLEFLNGIDGGHIIDCAPFGVGIPGAIEQVGRGAEEAASEIQEGNVLICVIGAVAAAAEQLLAFRVLFTEELSVARP